MQILVVPLVVAVVVVGLLWVFQRRLIYLPHGLPPPVEEVLSGWSAGTATTADGLELAVWYHQPLSGAPIVIVFNGNAGNRADRESLGRALASAGWGVVLFDYRGYGGNLGTPTESGLALDARAIVSFAADLAPASPMVFFGESLGAAVAVEVAVEHPPAALILRSPFFSLPDVAATHYPWLPVRLMLWDRYRSDERIGDVVAPVLVVAGSDDQIVPLDQSRRLAGLASDAELLVIGGARHNDVELLAGRELIEAVLRFVQAHT